MSVRRPLRAFALLALLPSLALADDFVPTRYDDPAPGPCLPVDCSLREAILAAWFGATALSRLEVFVEENKAVSAAILGLVLFGISLWVWWSRRQTRFDSNTRNSI